MSGFLKGVKDAGADCQEKFRWTLPLDQAKAVEKLTRLAASSKKLPTLFYCYSDALLFPALRGFAKTGLKVPSQVSLIGTENLYWGAHGLPAFTTVDLLEKVFAKHLADAIRDAASGESPYCVASPVRLVERETVESLL
jgi:DNA-binding LacI/PurR family transcriptional regulator